MVLFKRVDKMVTAYPALVCPNHSGGKCKKVVGRAGIRYEMSEMSDERAEIKKSGGAGSVKIISAIKQSGPGCVL